MRNIMSVTAAQALAAMSTLGNRVFGAANIGHAIMQMRKGRVYGNTSRYMPHQGKREIARRLRREGHGG